MKLFCCLCLCFFFNDTATTEIYTLSLHDALPICRSCWPPSPRSSRASTRTPSARSADRKSTRLNSSHGYISYAVFCLKKTNIVLPRYRPDLLQEKAQLQQQAIAKS